MSCEYMVGFFETDGGFQILFKKDPTMTLGYRVQPVAVFSQRNHLVLKYVMSLLKDHSIPFRWEDNTGKERASNVRIEGIQSVRTFCHLIDASHCTMYSAKWKDFLMMKQLYTILDQKKQNTREGRLQIIDLKCQLHGTEELKAINFRLPRREWERRHAFPKDASIGASSALMGPVCDAYEEHKRVSRLHMHHERLQVSGEYISGIIDGDGCISASIRTKKGMSVPKFVIDFTVVAEQGCELLLEVIAYYLDDMPIIRPVAQGKALYYSISSRPVLLRLLEHMRRFPILGKSAQSKMFHEIVLAPALLGEVSTSGLSYEDACRYATLIYETSPTRRRRTKTLSEVHDDFKQYFDHLSLPVRLKDKQKA